MPLSPPASPESKQSLIDLSGFVSGNHIALLENGTEYFPALEAALNAARFEVYLETYIFADDDTGRRIAAALQRAALRGVTIRVTVDGFGSKDLAGDILKQMSANGVEILVYRPEIARLNVRRHRLRRMHRKLAIIDAQVAFIGGINIIDDMDTPKHTPPRFDYAVRVEGPLLAQMYPAACRLWKLLSWTHFKRRWDEPAALVPVTDPAGSRLAAFVIRDNLGHRRDIEEAYLAAITAAREEIIIANAYFLPGINFRHALMAAAARGVKVRLLLQGRVEYMLLHYASRGLYGALLDAGVEIIEYHKSFMHAKVAVIDGEWATVGSSNIDPFSMLLAREANIIVRDQLFAYQLRASLEDAIRFGARPVKMQHWKTRPVLERAMTWGAYGMTRFLMGIFGYAQK